MENIAEYKNLILLRLGEIALKGLNRRRFENQLLNNLRYRLQAEGDFRLSKRDSRLWIENADESLSREEEMAAFQNAIRAVKDVFGYVSASPVRSFTSSMEQIKANVLGLAREKFADGQKHTFKFEVKRINKDFPMRSYDLACELGALVLNAFPEQAKVDVHDPDITFFLEIREQAYLYTDIIRARNGLPVGMGGKGMLMLSGGIDSPVAGYMMASRGMRVSCIYFHTFPYTSDEAKEKVIDLAKILTRYTGDLDLYVVNFTETQLALNNHVPEGMMTIVMRRMMVRISAFLAREKQIPCLITGESLGQVASQTVEGLVCTDKVADMPVFRPLIGMNKESIIEIARDIETYETSILPYEDCCTVFVAKHPKTHPTLLDAEMAEADLPVEDLVRSAVDKTEKISLKLIDELI